MSAAALTFKQKPWAVVPLITIRLLWLPLHMRPGKGASQAWCCLSSSSDMPSDSISVIDITPAHAWSWTTPSGALQGNENHEFQGACLTLVAFPLSCNIFLLQCQWSGIIFWRLWTLIISGQTKNPIYWKRMVWGPIDLVLLDLCLNLPSNSLSPWT